MPIFVDIDSAVSVVSSGIGVGGWGGVYSCLQVPMILPPYLPSVRPPYPPVPTLGARYPSKPSPPPDSAIPRQSVMFLTALKLVTPASYPVSVNWVRRGWAGLEAVVCVNM